MRFCLGLLVFGGVAARAQVPPKARIDTATASFMQWQLADFAAGSQGQASRLYQRPIYWPDANLGLSDTSRLFKYKLLLVHRADTTSYTAAELRRFRQYWQVSNAPALFTAADLRAMQVAFNQKMTQPWPASLTTLPLSRRRGKSQTYCAFTRPLFSADGQRAVIWQYLQSVGPRSRGQSGVLLLYKRLNGSTWQLVERTSFWSSVEDSL